MNCHLPEEETKINGNLQMNLYDLNKQIISQMPALDSEQMARAAAVIRDYVAKTGHTFYMLLCRDVNYYTLFHLVGHLTEPSTAEEVLLCATDLGAIKSVELADDDNVVEIWVEPTEDGFEPIVMYLFGYDGGVIECAP